MGNTNVYFIKAEEAIKIGIARDINKRLRSIQTGNQTKLEILHLITASEDEAQYIEAKIHAMFRGSHLNGEWYKNSQTLMDFIQQIKEHGWESHMELLDNEYQKTYKVALAKLREQLEQDIGVSNIFSLERLYVDLRNIRKKIEDHFNAKEISFPQKSGKLRASIVDWIEKREDPFVFKDITSCLGIDERKNRKHASTIINRLLENGMIERTNTPHIHNAYIFRKKRNYDQE